MSGLGYVRWRFWDGERYTPAQVLQLRQLRAFYTTHLAPVFGANLPDAFRLRTDGDERYPALTTTALGPPASTALPPTVPASTRPLKPFADSLLTTLAVFEAGRTQRWVGKGHPNDPTRLLGVWIRQISTQWLTHAPCHATTLAQVTALRQYFEALARDSALTQDGDDQGSMRVLLHNLSTPLSALAQRLQREIQLQSAREHFTELKTHVAQALDTASQYLFLALAEKDRTQLPFSLINVYSGVISTPLVDALQTREGCLLQQWLNSPLLRQAFLSDREVKATASNAFGPLSLFGTETPTPLLEEKGEASEDWRAFLQPDSALEEQFSAALRHLPLGVCPVLQSPDVLAQAIQCHGFLALLAEYQFYLHQCWQLVGFGGDHCVYDQMAAAITSILGELRVFNERLMRHLGQFQADLDSCYAQALSVNRFRAWQANYRQAKFTQEQLLGLLKTCETHLDQLLAHAQDRDARTERQVLAEQAYQALRHAPNFLNRARQHLGLDPQRHYPGLVPPTASTRTATSEPLTDIHWNQVTALFLPGLPPAAAWLSARCQQTPHQEPWRIFRGSHRRYGYLHGSRLKRLYQNLLEIQYGSATAFTPEKKALIERCQTQLRAEQGRIQQLRQGLWWPFHRASRRFFALWSQGITHCLAELSRFIPAEPKSPGLSAEGVQQRLLAPVLDASSVLERKASLPLKSSEAEVSSETKPIPPADPLTEGPFIPESTSEVSSRTPEASVSIDLQTLLREDELRFQEKLAALQREVATDREQDRQLLERMRQEREEFLRQMQQAHEAILKPIRQEREEAEYQLAQARAERLTLTHPELLRPGIPLAQARSPYFSFCWQETSHTMHRR